MLDKDISAQLQQYMGMLRRPFTLTATLGDHYLSEPAKFARRRLA